MHIDIDAAAGTTPGGDSPEDWKGRAHAAEARVVELEGQMRVLRVVLAAFDDEATGS